MASTGCNDCPISYPLDPSLSQQDKESILAFCQIKMNETQVQTQISSMITSSYSRVANFAQETSEKNKAMRSRSFIELSLSLLSMFQQDTEYYYQHQDVSMATMPIKDEDFSISVSKSKASDPNVSKVQMPKSVSSIFKNSKIVAMQCNQAVYNIPPIAGFQPPVLTLEIRSQSKVQSVKNLSQPITLSMYIKTTQRMKGVFYDASTSSWSNQGIETKQTTMADGATTEILIITRHLSTFSVIIDNSQPIQAILVQGTWQNLYITLGVISAFFFALLALSCLLDCSKVSRRYPHEKLKASDYNFMRVYKYSLLYNLPLISLFSYREKFIPACVKGLWLSMIFMIMILISLLFFMTTLIEESLTKTSLLITPPLALLILPNSLLIKILRMKTRNGNRVRPKQIASFRSSSKIKNNTKSSDDNSQKSRQKYKQHKMTVLLIIVSVVIGILGFVGIYYMTKKIVVIDNNSNRMVGVLTTFIGSLILGYIYGVLKLLVSTHVAINKSKSGKCIKILFLDLLTLKVVNYFLRISRSHNNSIDFINERDNKVQPQPIKRLRIE